MADRTTIQIEWDKGGKITYQISGVMLPPPRDDKKLWVLAPSALFLLAHQFGSMKPSHGLITCTTLLDMLFDNKYVLVPINSALKGATIDFIYTREGTIKLQFHPKHGMFANSDSLEEGVRQLLNNYFHYTYSQIHQLSQLMITRLTTIATSVYFDFLEEQLKKNLIGQTKDTWFPSFSLMSNQLITWLSQKYSVPKHGTDTENEQWVKVETEFLEKQRTELEGKRKSLFSAMGLN